MVGNDQKWPFKGKKSDTTHIYFAREKVFHTKTGKLITDKQYYMIPVLAENVREGDPKKGTKGIVPIPGSETDPDQAQDTFESLMFVARRKKFLEEVGLKFHYPVILDTPGLWLKFPAANPDRRFEYRYIYVKKGKKMEPGLIDQILSFFGV